MRAPGAGREQPSSSQHAASHAVQDVRGSCMYQAWYLRSGPNYMCVHCCSHLLRPVAGALTVLAYPV